MDQRLKTTGHNRPWCCPALGILVTLPPLAYPLQQIFSLLLPTRSGRTALKALKGYYFEQDGVMNNNIVGMYIKLVV